MPKVGGRRKKTRTHKDLMEEGDELLGKDPKAFIIKRGKVPQGIKQLVEDYKEIMYPNTSLRLQDNDKTKIKDYMRAAGYYQIQHMVILTATKKNCYMRFLKNPRGPTFTFRILNYSNRSEVLNAQRKFKAFSRIFCPPLLVMNGFQGDHTSNDPQAPTTEHMNLVGNMIQGMFPAINVQTASMQTQRRVVLFTHKEGKIYIRHYYIGYNQKGIDKKVKKILKANKMPNLSGYNSFGDFLQNNHQMFASDTEQSDLEEMEMDTKDNKKQQISLRLHEVGPRITLKLYKIEEGLLSGNVLYNRIVSKSNKAIQTLRKIKRKKLMLKVQRKEQQDQNVQRKKQNLQQLDDVRKKVKQQN